MTRRDRATLFTAARLLEAEAKCIHESTTIRAKGHPQFGQWPPEDHGAKADHDKMIATAQRLRKMAEKGLQ